jgi:predicted nucleic acid-binding protein
MIHLDTNLLIDILTARSQHSALIQRWLRDEEELAASGFQTARADDDAGDGVTAIS